MRTNDVRIYRNERTGTVLFGHDVTYGDEPNHTYVGWLPLRMAAPTADRPGNRIDDVGDWWLSAPPDGAGGASPSPGGPKRPVTPLDCEAEIRRRIELGFTVYGAEPPRGDTAAKRRFALRHRMNIDAPAAVGAAMAALREQEQIVETVSKTTWNDVELTVTDQPHSAAPETTSLNKALTGYVRDTPRAALDHHREKADRLRRRADQVIRAAQRLGAFVPDSDLDAA